MFKIKPDCVSKIDILITIFLYRKPVLPSNLYSSGFCIYLSLSDESPTKNKNVPTSRLKSTSIFYTGVGGSVSVI